MLSAVLALVAAMLATVPASAERAEPVALSGIAPVRDLQGHIDYFLDASRQLGLAEILSPEIASQFRIFRGPEPEFGYLKDNIWLRLRVTNQTGATADWKIKFHTNFMHAIDVFRVTADGDVTRILAQDHLKPFWTRPLAYPQLVADFALRKGDSVDLYVRYWSDGFSGLRVSIESANSFATEAFTNTAKSFLVQGILGLLVLAAVATFAVTRTLLPLAYALYLMSGALYVMHVDGYAFQYLWPGLPRFNGIASLVLGGLLAFCGANYVRTFLQTKRNHPWIDRLLLADMALVVGVLLASAVTDTQPLKQGMVLVVSASAMLFFIAGANAARHRFKEVRFFVLGWFGVILSAGLMSGRHIFGFEVSRELTLDSMRIVLVFDALMMGLALVDRFHQIRNQQRSVLLENLAVSRRNLDMHERLARLEQRYSEVSELATSRGRRIADVTHDLRQPIHALRLAVQHLGGSRGIGEGMSTSIAQTFDYLENLVEKNLSASLGLEAAEARVPRDEAVAQAFPCDLVLRQVREMFADEAESKGLAFAFVPCSVTVAGDPMALMRGVANLVSNAVKYTDDGKLLLGCRRGDGRLSIEVHDTGPGLQPEELESLRQRTARKRPAHQDPGGTGLGLAIVDDLADAHGWRLRAKSRPGRGSIFAIEVPVAAAQVPAASGSIAR